MEGTQHTMKGAQIVPFQPMGIILHEPIHPNQTKDKKDFINTTWNKVISGKKELESKIYQ